MPTATKINNRLTSLFEKKQADILNIYCTAGYPSIDSTVDMIKTIEAAGADMMEIGIPFSDPLADGLTIQKSNGIALKNGISMKVLFEQLKEIRQTVEMPLLLMGYFNPVLQYGLERFCQDCENCGVDGVIIPDLPIELYVSKYQALFLKHQLANVFLVTPQSSDNRIRLIDEHTQGFIYAISSASTTGSKSNLDGAVGYWNHLTSLNLKSPILTGFNIKNKATFNHACQHNNGAIIGSAFINAITDQADVEQAATAFIKSVLQ